MAIARFGRQAKRSYGFCVKMTAVAVLGLCFIFIWSFFSSSSSVASQRSTFGEFAEPASANWKVTESETQSHKKEPSKYQVSEEGKKSKFESDLEDRDKKRVNGSQTFVSVDEHKKDDNTDLAKKDEEKIRGSVGSDDKELQKEEGEEEEEVEVEVNEKERVDGEHRANEESEGDGELVDGDQEAVENVEDESGRSKSRGRKTEKIGPLFDPKAHYSWKLCSTRSKHNYIPCIDIESASGRLKSYMHHERSCPKTPPMCLVPLPWSMGLQ